MKIITEYLNFLQEREFGFGKKPSPTFAWELVYGKKFSGWRQGRCPLPHKTKIWKGISVDKDLNNKWLDDLSKIPNVEIRGSCGGHSKDWVTYVAFRLDPKYDKNKKFLDKVAKTLSKDKNTFCGWDTGMEKRPRFVCAAPLWIGCDKMGEWKKWWSTLASRINKVVN